MSIDFSKLIEISDSKGVIVEIADSTGKVIWFHSLFNYVSIGDSIAAGHTINDSWETDYGMDSQYGANGNQSTVIVPGSYTDRIRQELMIQYDGKISAKSFARSGDLVNELIQKLDHDVVKNALANANLVTISIGPNEILREISGDVLSNYINNGNPALDEFDETIQRNFSKISDDTYEYSYRNLFNKLKSINPNAKYVIMITYNPYKYLHLDDGKNGFLRGLLNTIPQMTILGFEVDEAIKDGLLSTDAVQMLFNRVNGLAPYVENWVTQLGNIMRTKITEYNDANFIAADAKRLFDTYPDRPYSAPKHYNDLVNVEFTRGFELGDADWGNLWGDSDAETYWLNLATKYTSLNGLDINGLASELVADMVTKVIVPDIDPHPEEYGQYALYRAFVDALGWQSVDRYSITYNANGGSGSMDVQELVTVDGLYAFTNLRTNSFVGATGYRFVGWNTAPDGSGTSYSNGQLVSINSNLTLYAQWSNIYTITYRHTNKTNLYGDDETGHKECYALWIAGTEQPDFGKFSEGTERTISVAYGTRVGVVVSGYNPSEITYDDADTNVYLYDRISNSFKSVAQGYGDRAAMYEFTLMGDVTIEFQWKIAGSLVTFNAKSWEDCYITEAPRTDNSIMYLDVGTLDSATLG